MAPWVGGDFGNPSSLYAEGRRARHAIDEAREALSSALDCLFAEVLFLSSGTEAANLAILGAALANQDPRRNRVLMGASEHHCCLNTRGVLERLGYRVELIPVDRTALLDLEALDSTLDSDVLLISVMHANNELGTIQPVAEIAEMAHGVGALYHCDAVQTLGPILRGEIDNSPRECADLASFSAHKTGGPKGVGALYVRAGVKLQPIAVGGAQEREMRAGTENVSGIVGFGCAVRVVSTYRASSRSKRDRFVDKLVEHGFVPTVPDREKVLGGHAHVRLPGVKAETMLIKLDRLGVSASSGAACSSGSLEPSHVLLACGYSPQEANEGLRFTFGAGIDERAADDAAERVISAAKGIASQASA